MTPGSRPAALLKGSAQASSTGCKAIWIDCGASIFGTMLPTCGRGRDGFATDSDGQLDQGEKGMEACGEGSLRIQIFLDVGETAMQDLTSIHISVPKSLVVLLKSGVLG